MTKKAVLNAKLKLARMIRMGKTQEELIQSEMHRLQKELPPEQHKYLDKIKKCDSSNPQELLDNISEVLTLLPPDETNMLQLFVDSIRGGKKESTTTITTTTTTPKTNYDNDWMTHMYKPHTHERKVQRKKKRKK
jgi:hypothetical protein